MTSVGAWIRCALTDTDVLQLRDDVMAQVTRHRSKGIIVDVTSRWSSSG